jgi:hypothetical protein
MAKPPPIDLKKALESAKSKLGPKVPAPARPKADDGLSLEKFAKAWMMSKNFPKAH